MSARGRWRKSRAPDVVVAIQRTTAGANLGYQHLLSLRSSQNLCLIKKQSVAHLPVFKDPSLVLVLSIEFVLSVLR